MLENKDVSANYNKTRINIGHQHDRWVELKDALRVQCHCACSSEIGTSLIDDAGRQAAHKKQRKYMLYTYVLKVNINFQLKKNFKTISKLNNILPLKVLK